MATGTWGEIAELQSQVEEIEQQRGSVSTHIRHDELLKQAWPVWISLCQSREQAKQLGEPIDFPADGLARLDGLRDRLADAEERRHAIREECEAAQPENRGISRSTRSSSRSKLNLNSRRRTLVARIRPGEVVKVKQISNIGYQVDGAPSARSVWTGTSRNVRSIDLSVPVGEQLDRPGRISAAEERRREAQGDVERLEAELRRAIGASNEMAAELDGNPPSATKDRRESKSADARRIRNNLVELAKQRDRLGHARQKVDDLRRQSTSTSTSKENASVVLPGWPAALLFLLLGSVAFFSSGICSRIGLGCARTRAVLGMASACATFGSAWVDWC